MLITIMLLGATTVHTADIVRLWAVVLLTAVISAIVDATIRTLARIQSLIVYSVHRVVLQVSQA